jgi:hypothetical protein
MSLLSENVIPGNHGKIFGTSANTETDAKKIQSEILKIKGVKDVIINMESFPHELHIHTEDIVSVKDVEDAAIAAGFHAIPKGNFGL